MLAQGVPPRAMMDVLGHAEIGVTMNTYARVLPELRQEAADPSLVARRSVKVTGAGQTVRLGR